MYHGNTIVNGHKFDPFPQVFSPTAVSAPQTTES